MERVSRILRVDRLRYIALGLYVGGCLANWTAHLTDHLRAGLDDWPPLSGMALDVLYAFWWPLFLAYGFF